MGDILMLWIDVIGRFGHIMLKKSTLWAELQVNFEHKQLRCLALCAEILLDQNVEKHDVVFEILM